LIHNDVTIIIEVDKVNKKRRGVIIMNELTDNYRGMEKKIIEWFEILDDNRIEIPDEIEIFLNNLIHANMNNPKHTDIVKRIKEWMEIFDNNESVFPEIIDEDDGRYGKQVKQVHAN